MAGEHSPAAFEGAGQAPWSALAGLGQIRELLDLLAPKAPQCLLLEGGSELERESLAAYWAALLNCASLTCGKPCLECASCRQIAAREFRDFLIYDGRISNREDEENPGPVRALNMENTRDLKRRLGDAGSARRVVLLCGLSRQRDEAANALLKVLEEPPPDTYFVLLTAQRQLLLPTLVSRSFCLTLPWKHAHEPVSGEKSDEWEEALCAFLASGRGLLERLNAKGALGPGEAQKLLLALQKSLARTLTGEKTNALDAALTLAFARPEAGESQRPLLNPALAARFGRWLNEAQDMLDYGVNPARILEALACRLRLELVRQKA